MKHFNKALLALIATSLFSVSAQAAVMDSTYERRGYVGIKAGQFTLDDVSFDDPIAYGAFAGYSLDPNFAIEVEYMGSGEVDIDIKNGSGKVDVNSYGAYAAYRYYLPSTNLYAKGKIGFATTETDITIKGTAANGNSIEATGSGRDTNLAGGVAIGYMLNDYISLEGEYDFMDADIDMMTFGAKVEY